MHYLLQSTLATPEYGTSNQLLNLGEGYTITTLLSGDGKVFFWSADGTSGWGSGSRLPRDLFSHEWGIGSTVNPRVSNCDGCDDSDISKGSSAYHYDVSADGSVAVFRSFEEYGHTTADGDPRNCCNQIYARDLNTLEVDLISGDDSGFIQDDGLNNIDFGQPSVSSDGRFVVFEGAGSYIRDRFAKEKEVLDSNAGMVTISGNGKSILLEKADGWYTLPNPYLVTTTNFTSEVLFINLLFSGNSWNNFDHMLLTDNNTWTGYLEFDGSGTGSFKFELGGEWDMSGNYVPGSSTSPGYGDNNTDGTAGYNEVAITLTQGAGRYKISFNDQTYQYTVKKLVDVEFYCNNGYTTLGQSVYVVGNIDELGNWSPANAVKLSPTYYPAWEGTLELPTNTNIEWKCIKRDELDSGQNLVWEPGVNNQFNPSSTQSTDGSF